mmetsp:Transcript_11130/g.30750  ORF Transcript_11130/g.30750 Transcript_11130/m.30750 type:complete len:158 (-) Transcript_11130:91-564(-)
MRCSRNVLAVFMWIPCSRSVKLLWVEWCGGARHPEFRRRIMLRSWVPALHDRRGLYPGPQEFRAFLSPWAGTWRALCGQMTVSLGQGTKGGRSRCPRVVQLVHGAAQDRLMTQWSHTAFRFLLADAFSCPDLICSALWSHRSTPQDGGNGCEALSEM